MGAVDRSDRVPDRGSAERPGHGGADLPGALANGWTYTADLIAADGGPWPALELDIQAKNGDGVSPATKLALP